MIGVLMLGLKLAGLLFGAAVILRLLIPARNKKRCCPRCRYEMEGVPGLRCPECGKTARHERKLLRKPRRKRTLALAAFLLLIAYSGVLGQRAIDDGWPSIIPSTALIAGYAKIDANATKRRNYPMSPALRRYYASIGRPYNVPQNQQNPWDSLWIELLKRADPDKGTLRQWQRRWLLDQAIDQGVQGHQMIRAAGGWPALNDSQRHRYVDSVVDRLLHPRKLSPVGSPLFARVFVPLTLTPEQLTIRARLPGGEWVTMNHDPGDQRDPFIAIYGSNSQRPAFNLGIARLACDRVDLDLNITDARHQFDWTGTVKLHAKIEGTLDQALPRRQSDELDRWLTDWISTGLVLTYQSKNDPNAPIESQLVLKVNGRTPGRRQSWNYQPPSLSTLDIVIDAGLELLAGNEVIGQGHSMWAHQTGLDPAFDPPQSLYTSPIVLDEDRFRVAIKNNERLTVRVVSTASDRSLRALYAKHRWEGTVTAPLGPTWAHNAAPPPQDDAE